MTIPVSIEKKRAFLHWFMQHHKVKEHDIEWFLKDLCDNDLALSHVRFVDDIMNCPKGIIITSHLNEQISFKFFKGKVTTDNVYTAYHEMNLYQHELIFIQLTFPFCTHSTLYQDVIEDGLETQMEIKEIAEAVLENTLTQGRESFLKGQINHALEERDYEQFMYYSSQLKKLQ